MASLGRAACWSARGRGERARGRGAGFLDRDATVTKACPLIAEAVGQGASLVLSPEAFVAGYPDWVWRTLFGYAEARTAEGPASNRGATANGPCLAKVGGRVRVSIDTDPLVAALSELSRVAWSPGKPS